MLDMNANCNCLVGLIVIRMFILHEKEIKYLAIIVKLLVTYNEFPLFFFQSSA